MKDGKKRRPALLLTRDAAIPLLRSIVVAPTTRTIRGIPTEVALGRSDGMPDECVVACDNVRVVHKSQLSRRITSLSASRLEQVCDALSYALGC
jgi:mRNA interferase MazF